jgi:hypothetical protein
MSFDGSHAGYESRTEKQGMAMGMGMFMSRGKSY